MKECLYLTQSQKGRFSIRRFAQVHDKTYMRSDIFARLLYPLPLILCHPCSIAFAIPWVEIHIQYSKVGTIIVEDLIGFHVRMIDRNISIFLECNAIKSGGKSEDTFYNIANLKIGTEHFRVKVITFFFKKMGIVGTIPWFHLEILTFNAPCIFNQFFLFFQSHGLICLYHFVYHLIDTLYA